MLPTEDASAVAAELTRRFGVARWSFALTATDANRWAIRLSRAVTGRPKILFNSWCYHGTVDESLIVRGPDGAASRPGNVGAPVDVTHTSRVAEYNDLGQLERELAHGDVAAVLMEPALTNMGIVLPEPGYLDGVRELTRSAGTLLVIDETHTLSAGTRRLHRGVAARARHRHARQGDRRRHPDRGLRAGRAAGRTADLPRRPRPRRHRWRGRHAGRQRPVPRRHPRHPRRGADRGRVRGDDRAGDPLHGGRGADHRRRTTSPGRWPSSAPGPSTGSAVRRPATAPSQHAATDEELEDYLHVFLVNRDILLTPFHNMALMCPATTAADVDRHLDVLDAAVVALGSSFRAWSEAVSIRGRASGR